MNLFYVNKFYRLCNKLYLMDVYKVGFYLLVRKPTTAYHIQVILVESKKYTLIYIVYSNQVSSTHIRGVYSQGEIELEF